MEEKSKSTPESSERVRVPIVDIGRGVVPPLPLDTKEMDWITIRNAQVMKYLSEPHVKELILAINNQPDFASDTASAISGTSSSPPSKPYKARAIDNTVNAILEQYKRQLANNGGVVHFSPEVYQDIMLAKWAEFRCLRVEKMLARASLSIQIPTKDKMALELQRMYGPMDTTTKWFQNLVFELTSHRSELAMGILESEKSMLKEMQKGNLSPSDFNAQALLLQGSLKHLPEMTVDQNPFTANHKMDFWVFPRPRTTIGAYQLRHRETDNFAEFQLLDQGQGKVVEGYSPAIFDVGWYYHPFKVHSDISREDFFKSEDPHALAWRPRKIHEGELKKWNERLLKFRKHLGNYHPWGVELKVFCKSFRGKEGMWDDEPIFGLKKDEEGVNSLKDIFYCQKLEDKTILFDALFEGQINTPLEILERLWQNVLLLLELQPNQTLAVDKLKTKYEEFYKKQQSVYFPEPENVEFEDPLEFCKMVFPGTSKATLEEKGIAVEVRENKQKVYFPEQWGFEDPRELVKFCRRVFPESMATKKLKTTHDKDGVAVIKLVDLEEEEDPWKEILDQEGEKTEEEKAAEEKLEAELMEKYGHLLDSQWLCD